MEKSRFIKDYMLLNSVSSVITDRESAVKSIRQTCRNPSIIGELKQIAQSEIYFVIDDYLDLMYNDFEIFDFGLEDKLEFCTLLWIYDYIDEFKNILKSISQKDYNESIEMIQNFVLTKELAKLEPQSMQINNDILILCYLRNYEKSGLYKYEIYDFLKENHIKYMFVNRSLLFYLEKHKKFNLIIDVFDSKHFPDNYPLSIFYVKALFESQKGDQFWTAYNELIGELYKINGTSLYFLLSNELNAMVNSIENRTEASLNEIKLHSNHFLQDFYRQNSIDLDARIPQYLINHPNLIEIILRAGLLYNNESNNNSVKNLSQLANYLEKKKDSRFKVFNSDGDSKIWKSWFGFEVNDCKLENGLPVGVSIIEILDVTPAKLQYSTIPLKQIRISNVRRTLDLLIDLVFIHELQELTIVSINRAVIDNFDSQMKFVSHPSIVNLKSLELEHVHASPGFYNSLLTRNFKQLKILHLNYVNGLQNHEKEHQIQYLIQNNNSLHSLFELHLEGSVDEGELDILKDVDFKNLDELNLSSNEFHLTEIDKIIGAAWFANLKVLDISYTDIESQFLQAILYKSDITLKLRKLSLYSNEPISSEIIEKFQLRFNNVELEFSN